MEHLTDRELFGFALADTADGNIMALGRKINSHIIYCEECAERYRVVIAAAEAVNAMIELDEGFTVGDFCTDISAEAVAAQAAVLESENFRYNV